MESVEMYVNDIRNNVIQAIETGNPKTAYAALVELGETLLKDKNVAYMIASPPVITEMHKKLMEHLEIPDRLLLLRNRVPSVHRRAVMFNAIMVAAIKKVHNDKLV